ncbi:MAG: PQQ-dependent sugar dehydrogenase [Chloroflexota bacterium]
MPIRKLLEVTLLTIITLVAINQTSFYDSLTLARPVAAQPNGLPDTYFSFMPIVHADFHTIELIPITSGFYMPTDVAHAGDDRLFVTEKDGRIYVVEADGTRLPNPFLDIRDLVSVENEQGLLGLTFHPAYQTNGVFYITYSHTDDEGMIYTRLARYIVSQGDPNLADPNSEVILLTLAQPTAMHKAGDLSFGPDGYLYASVGDGGGSGDPYDRGQDGQSLLGKILRLDVDGGFPYAIPPDNPFVNDPTVLDEIWAMGLRNPWRFSFDRQTGDLYIADVGEGLWEEIDFQPAGSAGGQNYGWRCYEGNHEFTIVNCGAAADYDFPVYEYGHDLGCAVVGGFVYRGSLYPVLSGYYFFTDWCTGQLWRMRQDTAGNWLIHSLNQHPLGLTAFGEDAAGELYVASSQGTLYRLAPGP